MAPWWRKHRHPLRVCESCGGNVDVRRGLCRKCRQALSAGETPTRSGTPIPVEDQALPEPPDLEPPHARPWVQRGGAD